MKKLTAIEAMEKALDEYPDLKYQHSSVLTKNGDYCGVCAVGLALVGNFGLDKVIEANNLEEDLYSLYNRVFPESNDIKVFCTNDDYTPKEGESSRESFKAVIELLKEKFNQ